MSNCPFTEDELLIEPVPTGNLRPLRLFDENQKADAYIAALYVVPTARMHFLGGSAGLNMLARDIDVFVLVNDLDEVALKLEDCGFTYPHFHGYTGSNFIPFRKGDLNIVAMDDEKGFIQTQLAYRVCQYLVSEKIQPTKEQRKAIHRILRGEPVNFVTP